MKIGKMKKDMNFEEWLVGFTEGGGCFSFIERKKGGWDFRFRIGQKKTNGQLLYFIKEKVGVGKVYFEKNRDMGVYVVGRRDFLIEKIVPIFDKNPLLTRKSLDYYYWRKGLFLSKLGENEGIKKLREEFLERKKNGESVGLLTEKLSKWWVVGFIEAEGSFYLVKKDKKRIVHAFGIGQTEDEKVLEKIRKELDSFSKSRVKKKKNSYNLEMTSRDSIKKIIKYFEGTMKGNKSLNFKIWVRSFRKKMTYDDLVKIQELMGKIREGKSNQ